MKKRIILGFLFLSKLALASSLSLPEADFRVSWGYFDHGSGDINPSSMSFKNFEELNAKLKKEMVDGKVHYGMTKSIRNDIYREILNLTTYEILRKNFASIFNFIKIARTDRFYTKQLTDYPDHRTYDYLFFIHLANVLLPKIEGDATHGLTAHIDVLMRTSDFATAHSLATSFRVAMNPEKAREITGIMNATMTVRLEEIGTSSLRFSDSEAAVLEKLSSGDAFLAMLPEADPIRLEMTARFTGIRTRVLAEVARRRDERERIAAAAAAKTASDVLIAELMRRLAEQEERAARLEAERDAARVKAATFEAAAADAAKARSATPSRPRPTAAAGGAGARPSPAASSSRASFLRSPAASGGLPTTPKGE